jgi:hypothetical protein
MIQLGYTPPADLSRVSVRALIIGVIFTVVLIVGTFIDRKQFFHAYLVGFILWIGLTLGSLALLMLQHLTGGAWGLVIRRVLEASTRTLPLMIILFIPIIFGLKDIYLWTDPVFMKTTSALQQSEVLKSLVLSDPRGYLFCLLVAAGTVIELAVTATGSDR